MAATYNPVSDTRMISFLVDFPTCLLAELRTHRILTQGSLYEHMELDDFNMSANSARAIPSNKYLQKVLDNPFIPIWTKQQKGMSGKSLPLEIKSKANEYWLSNLKDKDTFHAWIGDGGYMSQGYESQIEDEDFEDTNIGSSIWSASCTLNTLKSYYEKLIALNIHKQNANRLLSPFAYITCIISGTEWDNFFELRCPKYKFAIYNEQGNEITHYEYAKSKKEHIRQIGVTKPEITSDTFSDNYWNEINKSSAQPEFQVIAEMLYDLYQEADWKESKHHIPFESDINKQALEEYLHKNHKTYEHDQPDSENILNQFLMLVSASMCAKLSYNTQENEDTLEKHLERANMLIESKHWEPFSHQAVSMDKEEYEHFGKMVVISPDRLKEYDKHTHDNEIICELPNGRTCLQEKGWAYNLRGFISQRYILENMS